MLTKPKVTEKICMCDDLCRLFNNELSNHVIFANFHQVGYCYWVDVVGSNKVCGNISAVMSLFYCTFVQNSF